MRTASIYTKGLDLIRALLGGRSRRVLRQRLQICDDCEHVLRDGDRMYCGECGCGHWPLAELHHKLGYKRLRCPVNKWGDAAEMDTRMAGIWYRNRVLQDAGLMTPRRMTTDQVRRHMRPLNRKNLELFKNGHNHMGE